MIRKSSLRSRPQEKKDFIIFSQSWLSSQVVAKRLKAPTVCGMLLSPIYILLYTTNVSHGMQKRYAICFRLLNVLYCIYADYMGKIHVIKLLHDCQQPFVFGSWLALCGKNVGTTAVCGNYLLCREFQRLMCRERLVITVMLKDYCTKRYEGQLGCADM